MCRVHANGSIGRAWAARDHAHARFTGEFGVRLGHEGGSTLLAANHEAKIVSVTVQAVEYFEVALAGHPKGGVNTVGNQGIGDQVATGTGKGFCWGHTCKLNE